MTTQAEMFQRLSNLLFGEVEEVAADLKGPNPCVTEADEEGWMLVNLTGESKSSGMERWGESVILFKHHSRKYTSQAQNYVH